ncbi:hypothetical protein FGG08_003505 [Glutinoglossum americanum]|uniref:Btz domain-containing protein n=1 Tax=Glutinoglossum americanum TaxID=1670608 RepID=A0A9P8I6Z0_9PEZI|nr:hypothetical protein FGG08_003505 [Glutinoglossum americanum]
MGPRKNLLASRRRVEDDGEEEGGLDTVELEDDSMSETSVHSEEDEEDMDGSDTSEIAGEDANGMGAATTNGHVKVVNGAGPRVPSVFHDPLTCVGGDTEAMMNGLKISGDQIEAEEINFEDMTEDMDVASQAVQQAQPEGLKNETPSEKRRREHEEYKKRRDADPAFVPNRGAFFMHDHRHAGPAANGFRPFGRGRGRGRGAIGGPYSPANQMEHASEATQSPWAHDMHETVAEADARPSQPSPFENSAPSHASKNIPFAPKSQPPNRSLSKTTHIGNIQIRVFIAGMRDSIIFSGVPVKQYTRLPHHRPPLRRDKPVRISLPDQPVRYIYPAPDRSFIFIPRAQRPNQQGFGRGRGKPSFGVYSGYGSRRTSVYGGSNYTPSVAMSRRSSLAHELHRENVISPTGSAASRHYGLPDSSKPVVKLPPSVTGRTQQSLQETTNMDHQGSVAIPAGPAPKSHYSQPYPPPQKPTYRENRPVPIPMHQPRPQKAVSVADIESPATHSLPIPQQKQQPFHQQVPSQPNGHAYPQDPTVYNPHSRQPSYPGHASTGTPLSHIPESAIHARPFQPVPYQHQQFYPQPAILPQAAYYYQIPDPRPPPYSAAIASTAVSAPVFVPSPQQNTYLVPVPTVSGPPATQPTGQGNTVAQESNGMVYYYDSSQFYTGAAGAYPPAGYALPPPQPGGVVGMGGMMTPSPDVYYYPQPGQGGAYYGQQ